MSSSKLAVPTLISTLLLESQSEMDLEASVEWELGEAMTLIYHMKQMRQLLKIQIHSQ